MEKKHPIEDIDIYGEQVREVLSKPPSWLVLTGSSIVFTFIAALLFLSFIIKYPDVLSGRVVITSQSPPVSILSKVNGRIEKLLVQDNDSIEQGQQLAIIENSAKYEDIKRLSILLEEIDPNCRHIDRNIDFPNDFQLGEIQDFMLLL